VQKKEQLIKLTTKDHKEITLWKINSAKENNKHVFLTHGTFSNKKIMLGIANYLANIGYTCWIMEWRNHGESKVYKDTFNIETIGLIDIKTTFNYLIDNLNLNNLHCITHSGGGIALTLFLIKNKTYSKNIKSIVFFNCQAFGAVNSKLDFIKIYLAKHFSSILGFVPAIRLGIGVQNEKYFTMKSWFDWNLTKSFKGIDGFDYFSQMKTIQIPILLICGKNDWIAPIHGCEKYLNGFDNQTNKLVVCGISNGFKENYNHSRTILSKNASKEIWQIASNWIKKHQT